MRFRFVIAGAAAMLTCCCAIAAETAKEADQTTTSAVSEASTTLAASNEISDDAIAEKTGSVMSDAADAIAKSKKAAPTEKPLAPINRLEEVELTIDALMRNLTESNVLTAAKVAQIKQDVLAQTAKKEAAKAEEFNTRTVRVPYVPESVRNDLRDQVRQGLREDVVGDVIAQAKQEQWGLPQALPSWVNRIKLGGDFRTRGQVDFFAASNPLADDVGNPYWNYAELNKKRNLVPVDRSQILNTSENRERIRARLRLKMDAKVTEGMKVGVRASTGKDTDPVSTNQTGGNSWGRAPILLDQAFFNYVNMDARHYPSLTLEGGKIRNPWVSTDLLWDSDLNFEGLAAKYQLNLSFGGDLLDQDDRSDTLWLTVGGFPIQEVEFSRRDKWLFGAQVATEFGFDNQSKLTFSAAYYDYVNVQGELNALGETTKDFTAPQFFQRGNAMVDIDNTLSPDKTTSNRGYYALASDYNIVDLNASLDLASFAPIHVWLTFDYVKNIGFDAQDIQRRFNLVDTPIEHTQGYQVMVSTGWPHVSLPGNWRFSLAYKYLEADAVLDAFTDSDFHLGGTDAQGYIIGADYGVMENTWISARWLSADAIHHPTLGIDVLQIDLNMTF